MSSILGPDGSPIKKDSHNFSLEVEAYIESKVNTAMDNARTQLQSDINAKGIKQIAYYAVFVCFSLFFAFGIAPQYISKWTRQFVESKMAEPTLKEIADDIIKTKMEGYIDSQIKPLTTQANALSTTIETISNDINTKQTAISEYFENFKEKIQGDQKVLKKNIKNISNDTKTKQKELGQLVKATSDEIMSKQDDIILKQEKIKKQLNLQQSSIAAKAGSLDDYETLLKASKEDNEQKNIALVLIKEIEIFYDSDRSNLSFNVLRDKKTNKDPGYSTEELLYIYKHRETLKKAAVNTIYKKKDKSTVQFLCESIANEGDLRVLSRVTKTVSALTGEKFKPLEYDLIKSWWSNNNHISEYQSNYNGYLKVRNDIETHIKNGAVIQYTQVSTYTEQLSHTISSHPKAICARCLRGGFLTMLGNYEEAEKEFEEVRKINRNFRWLKLWESALLIKKDKIKDAEDMAVSVLKEWPGLITEYKYWHVFNPIEKNLLDRVTTKESVVN